MGEGHVPGHSGQKEKGAIMNIVIALQVMSLIGLSLWMALMIKLLCEKEKKQ